MDFFVTKYFDQTETQWRREEWLIETSHSRRPSRMVDRYHGFQVIKVADTKNVVKNFGQNILKERDLLE
jgi:hypothetical protein